MANDYYTDDEYRRIAGLDSDEQLASEMAFMEEEFRVYMEEMEAAFGPWVCTVSSYIEECPF